MFGDAQLKLIAQAVADAATIHEVLSRLEAADDPDDSLRPARFAFGFHFLVPDSEDRGRRGGAWGPMNEMNGHQFPPPLESLDDEILTAWEQMLGAIKTPAVQARCGDLLWVRKHGSRPDQAA